MSKSIVFGASGQLGQCLKKVAADRGIDFLIYPGEHQANILDVPALTDLFETHRPAYCINCAAYTAVDKAEDDPAAAFSVNKTGADNLAVLCSKYNIILIHISTDFVFNGDGSAPLSEDSPTAPVNVYGQSKLDGESVIQQRLSNYFIIRTGWLYSEYGSNFVKTMLKLGAERRELKVIADQTGTPTYAIDLAGCIIDIILSDSSAYGIYNYSNEGVATWYEFASTIFELAGADVRVLPIPSREYVTRASRPHYSVMDKSKIARTFNLQIPYWKDSLAVCISRLKQ
jgi:dTDP-4-dehydrorhamnose reductase